MTACCAIRSRFLPLGVGEDEFPQLQVPKNDPLLVAGPDGFGDLPEQPPGLGLAEPPPLPDVGVEVAVGPREDEVEVAVADEDLVEGRDSRIALEAVVSAQQVVAIASYHLE